MYDPRSTYADRTAAPPFPGTLPVPYVRASLGARTVAYGLDILFIFGFTAFLLTRGLLSVPAIRMRLTPRSVKAGRVRRRALALFAVSTEKRTADHVGVLLYLSLAEHQAEIIADRAIHERTTPACWGEAMAALVDAVRDGRPADGMADAIARIGDVLALHFPKTSTDRNELPDRLIEL